MCESSYEAKEAEEQQTLRDKHAYIKVSTKTHAVPVRGYGSGHPVCLSYVIIFSADMSDHHN